MHYVADVSPMLVVRRIALLCAVVPVAAATVVFVASLVPDRLILGELTAAIDRKQIMFLPQVGISGRGVATFSDCIALTMGLGDPTGGISTLWLRSPPLGSCAPALASLGRYDAGQGLSGGYEYYRYWHGYTAVSRPLVATIGGAGQRIVLLWTLVGALALLARRLWAAHGARAPIALLGPFLLTTDTVELARTIPHGVPALVAVFGAWWLHRVATAPPDEHNGLVGPRDLTVASWAFVVGAAYVYVELLNTQTGAWELTIEVVALASSRTLHGAALVRRSVLAGVGWIVGWVWTWVSKWAMAVVVLGFDAVRDNVGGAIDDRVAGERTYIDLAPFNAIKTNVEVWWQHPLTPPVLVAIALASVVLARRQAFGTTWLTRMVIAAPAVIPLVWFEVLRNHSLVHPGFVYRSLGVTAGLIAVARLVAPDRIRPEQLDGQLVAADESAALETEQPDDEGREHELSAHGDG